MVTFTRIPEHYTPLGGTATYAFQSDAPQTVDVRITDDTSGALLGAKRFASVTEAVFDAAPMLRRSMRFVPSVGGTGVYPANGRQAMASAELFTDSSDSVAQAFAPTRIFLPCKAAAVPALLTTMPAERLIAPGECDELTLLFDRACSVTVTAEGSACRVPVADAAVSAKNRIDGTGNDGEYAGSAASADGAEDGGWRSAVVDALLDTESSLAGANGTVDRNGDAGAEGESLVAQSYPVSTAGLYLFRLDTRDFPQAERIRVDAGSCGTVCYTLIPSPQGSVRLAWRSSAGSIEHYTFPVVRETTVETVRREAHGPDGRTAAGAVQERQHTLVSAYEAPRVLEALAELHATPSLWIAQADGYIPADIVPETLVVRRHGEMRCLEFTLRPTFETRLPWN